MKTYILLVFVYTSLFSTSLIHGASPYYDTYGWLRGKVLSTLSFNSLSCKVIHRFGSDGVLI